MLRLSIGLCLLTVGIFLFIAETFAAQKLSCESENNGSPQSLEIELEGEKVIGFSYSGLTPALDKPHKFSCSLEANRRDGLSEWKDKATQIVIALKEGVSSEDRVTITKDGNSYNLNFEEISPSNCGHSSTIATSITLVKGKPECQAIEMRD